MSLTLRLAVPEDLPALRDLMNASIGELLKPFLAPDEVAASFDVMGLDSQLIVDGTYFVVEDGAELAGCGGWSRRATLFGGDHSAGRDAALLDPTRDAARVRAMYTHPDHVRKGVGRLILKACEAAAAGRGSRVANWPEPWPASRCTGPAAIMRSSGSPRRPPAGSRCRWCGWARRWRAPFPDRKRAGPRTRPFLRYSVRCS